MLYFREAFVVTSSKQMSAFGRPIVFYTGADPVEAGLVASLNRPGGNVTGLSSMNGKLTAKRFGLLHQLLPGAGRLAFGANVVVFATGQPSDDKPRTLLFATAQNRKRAGIS